MRIIFSVFFLFQTSAFLTSQEDPLVYFNRGTDLSLNKDFKGALEAYDKALQLDPNLYYIYASRAESKTELGDFKGALADYNAYQRLVEDLNLLGDPEVLDKRKKLISLVPGASSESNITFNDNIYNPTDELLNSSDEQKALYYRGKVKFESGDITSAIRDFSAAISRDSSFVPSYIGRGYCYLKLRDLTLAYKDFDIAVLLNPKEYYGLIGRGEVKDKLRNYASAVEDFSQAITVSPGKYAAFYDRGLAWFNQKNFAKAEEDFSQVIKLNPKHEKAFFNRAVAKINQRRSTEACIDLEMAKSLGHSQAGIYLEKFCK